MEKSSRSKDRPGSPRARLFLALDLPPGYRTKLGAWRDEALRGRSDLRPVPPEALHVTLVFLGYRPEKEIDRIASTAFDALGGLRPALLQPDDVKPIPPRRPRLFALDLHDRDGAATAIQQAAADALAAARFYRPEKRPFWPHITFARVKRNARAEPLDAPPAPAEHFEAGEVTLYRSLLSPQGARYEALARLRLA